MIKEVKSATGVNHQNDGKGKEEGPVWCVQMLKGTRIHAPAECL